MSHATIVYIGRSSLLLRKPGKSVYHRLDRNRAEWPRYVDGERIGNERQWTACGRLIYVNDKTFWSPKMEGLRLDNANRVARPCWKCWA